jgi:hypothetical protein
VESSSGGFRRGGDESAVPTQSLRLGGGEEGARERERRREGGGEVRPWLDAEDWGSRRWETAPTGVSCRSATEGRRRGR